MSTVPDESGQWSKERSYTRCNPQGAVKPTEKLWSSQPCDMSPPRTSGTSSSQTTETTFYMPKKSKKKPVSKSPRLVSVCVPQISAPQNEKNDEIMNIEGRISLRRENNLNLHHTMNDDNTHKIWLTLKTTIHIYFHLLLVLYAGRRRDIFKGKFRPEHHTLDQWWSSMGR